jgi:NAD(P)-dependent dehydrogenase (short-subunit alcohol dehydrogenase family)
VDIRDKVVVITGGASGIGAAMASQFDSAGAGAVVVLDIDGAGATDVAAAVGGEAMQLDVADDQRTAEVIAAIEQSYGRIDILCLNAGIAPDGSVDEPNEVWQTTWDVNVMSHVYATRYALPRMIERGEGYLVHTASAAGLLTSIGTAPYSVTKHAVVALAEWLAITYGDRGIRVSALCPQFVDTPMLDAYAAKSAEMRDWVMSNVVTAEDVANAVISGIEAETFLILPHPEVGDYFVNKATDYDRWLAGMRNLQRGLDGS